MGKGQLMYKRCGKCKRPMHGLKPSASKKIRSKCQDCGGNKTGYDRDNPHPESKPPRSKKHGPQR